MSDRFSAVINKTLILDFIHKINNVETDVFDLTKIEIFSSLEDAQNSVNQIETLLTWTRTSEGNYIYEVSEFTTSGSYFDKITYIDIDGNPETEIIQNFYVREECQGLPGNATSITFSEEGVFQNTNGSISFIDDYKNIVLYSPFDISTNAKFAHSNITSIEEGTPQIITGGAYGNYINLLTSSIKYTSDNFENCYKQCSIQTKIRLDFDNAPSYQEFLSESTTGSILLSSVQNANNIIFYSSFNSSIDAVWGDGNLVATGYNSISYGAGGKFGNALLLTTNDNRYLTYSSVDNFPILIGTISFWIKPNYSGSPINNQEIFSVYKSDTDENKITFTHNTDGNLILLCYDYDENLIINHNFGNFTPNTYDIYNFELDFDFYNGETRLFINGVQKGTTNNNNLTRDTDYEFIQIGSSTLNNNFLIDELIIYNKIINTSTFTPSETQLPTSIPYSDTYSFKLKINNIYENDGNDLDILIEPSDTFQNISDKINNILTNCSAAINNLTGKIRITADAISHDVEILPPTSTNNLITLLGGIDTMIIPNGPTSDTVILEFYNGINNNNRIRLIHSTIGELILKMWDSTGMLRVNNNFGIWSSISNNFYELLLEFDESIYQLYIDGIKIGNTSSTGFTRSQPIDFFIRGGLTDTYGYDELIIYDIFKYYKPTYTVSTIAQSEYPTNNPSIILNYGTDVKIIDDILIDYSGTLAFIPYIGNIGYYYLNNRWIVSDGTVSQSNNAATLKSYISGLAFDITKEFKIKVFFISDGNIQTSLNRLFIVLGTEVVKDYSPIISWIRKMLGEPRLPVELADCQIEAAIEEAIERWLYFRYAEEDMMTISLRGSAKTGFDIPEGWENFHDIIFSPRSPVSGLVYSGDWGKNIYLQYYYSMVTSGGGFMQGLLSDFYMTMSAISDSEIILGMKPTYQVFNGKLFIHPDPVAEFTVGLIKQRTPSIDEINNDMWLKRYALAVSKIMLGQLRETVSQIPSGMDNIPLNGSQLKSEGAAEKQILDNEFLKRAEPLFLDFF